MAIGNIHKNVGKDWPVVFKLCELTEKHTNQNTWHPSCCSMSVEIILKYYSNPLFERQYR